MTRKRPAKGSSSNKKSGPKSEKTDKKFSSGRKTSFSKKPDSANDKTKSFSKSKKNDFRKIEIEKNSSFEKRSPFPKKGDFSPRKDQSFSENKREVKKREKEKGSPFGEKKFFQKKKDFTPGKGKPSSGSNSEFRKKDTERGSSFDKTPSFSRKRSSDSSNEKRFSETKKDFSRKESDKGYSFGKKTSPVKSKDFAPGKGKSFSKSKTSGIRKKDFTKGLQKTSPAPIYDLKKSQGNKGADSSSDDLIRLNRYIANSGVCSRREADELIALGEITVNGKVITELGYKVSRNDVVKYNSKVLKPEKFVYILLNKPKDFITTTEDPQDRKTVMALVENACKERVYPVGRLDRNTTGLLLLTNDGELAKKLTHPSSNIKKLYQADLDKPLLREDFEKILEGLTLEDGPVRVDALAFVSPDKRSIGIEIHEGRNRIVRRIFEHLGYDVVKLDRVMYAGLTKKDLPRGNWKFLTEKEVVQLKHFL